MRNSLSESTTVKLIRFTNAVHTYENVADHMATFDFENLSASHKINTAVEAVGVAFSKMFGGMKND